MIQLTDKPIDTSTVLSGVGSPEAGAVVLFLGAARRTTAGRRTDSLEYECYPEMAEKELGGLEAQARSRWPLLGCTIVHRLGWVEIGQTSVAIAVSSAHRQAAFEAGSWLIDRVKQVVPIWKKENWADGTSQWVHPGLDVPAASQES
jgi:molybdopterin synthase catalytic subunit